MYILLNIIYGFISFTTYMYISYLKYYVKATLIFFIHVYLSANIY